MKIKIQKIEDPNTNIPINSEAHRIEQIKNEIVACKGEKCKTAVFDMWDDLPS